MHTETPREPDRVPLEPPLGKSQGSARGEKETSGRTRRLGMMSVSQPGWKTL